MDAVLRALLCCVVLAAAVAVVRGAAAQGAGTPAVPVTALPPLQAVPATRVSRQVQQRMRQCNAQADQKQLAGTARETFIKSCMAHRSRRPASAPTTTASTRAPATSSASTGAAASAPMHKP